MAGESKNPRRKSGAWGTRLPQVAAARRQLRGAQAEARSLAHSCGCEESGVTRWKCAQARMPVLRRPDRVEATDGAQEICGFAFLSRLGFRYASNPEFVTFRPSTPREPSGKLAPVLATSSVVPGPLWLPPALLVGPRSGRSPHRPLQPQTSLLSGFPQARRALPASHFFFGLPNRFAKEERQGDTLSDGLRRPRAVWPMSGWSRIEIVGFMVRGKH